MKLLIQFHWPINKIIEEAKNKSNQKNNKNTKDRNKTYNYSVPLINSFVNEDNILYETVLKNHKNTRLEKIFVLGMITIKKWDYTTQKVFI